MDIDKLGQINILLIDSEEVGYIITHDLLSEIGEKYIIHWINDFNKGLEEIAKNEYDICLLDYHLGDQNGIDFINESNLINCRIPIILLTGRDDREIDLLAINAGASDYLNKNRLDSNSLERAIRYTLERKKSEERITFLSHYDQLTNLPNRTLFYNRLDIAFTMAKRHSRVCGIMYLDIDNFKRINDSLGYSSGDRLIKEVGNRLNKCIRREDMVVYDNLYLELDTVARLGGDEFTILLSEIKEPENASKVAERIQNVLAPPIIIDERQINVTVSIGIAIYPNDGENIDTLIKNADIAMYNAKSEGKNNFRYYNLSMNSIAFQKLNMENELRKAIENNELELYYQPMIDLKTKIIKEVEILVRWNHPQKGIVAPMEFIPIAEETGLIIDIGNYVLNAAGIFYDKCKKNELSKVGISINISPKQLNQKTFIDHVAEFKRKFSIPYEKLTFEITESCIINNLDEANKIINSIKSMGVRISLDDFGSGYSSFTVLKKIPFDIIKIDRSFIENIPDNTGDSSISSSIISIGHSMNLTVVAEGIENEDQLFFLEKNMCDIGQGYYFSRPIPENELLKLIKSEEEKRFI